MSSSRRNLLDELRARLFAKINVSIALGNNKRVAVGNRATVTLEDNQPINPAARRESGPLHPRD